MRNLFLVLTYLFCSCTSSTIETIKIKSTKIPVIFDTDANNEVDDQHALAYLLFNGAAFDVKAITVNATSNGGNIIEHFTEAERIMKLSTLDRKIPLLKGANSNFPIIRNQLNSSRFDGSEAVNFIIHEAQNTKVKPLVILAVGKLTNVALALQKEPGIISNIRLVWLGSNYPEPGEYNQDNDTSALNYVLHSNVPFEMVMVRYGKSSGTDVVRILPKDIKNRMSGKGPKASSPIIGRHGNSFTYFGDYSVNLFEHVELYGNPPARSLFDMAAVAIVKNPGWAKARQIPAPMLQNNIWVEKPENKRKIIIWENFNAEKIKEDFFQTMENYVLVDY